MKWIYGKQDWKTLERGQENCFLMTNGLGGFSSQTMLGSAARNDHALLMGCVQAPNHRCNLIHRLRESVRSAEEEYVFSSQEFAGKSAEEGFVYLSSFVYEDIPVWTFHIKGVEIRKEAALAPGRNAVGVRYTVRNRSQKDVCLAVEPYFQFMPKGQDMPKEQRLIKEGNRISANGLSVQLSTNGTVNEFPQRTEQYFYSYDVCDGRRSTGYAAANHEICLEVEASETKILDVVYDGVGVLGRVKESDGVGEPGGVKEPDGVGAPDGMRECAGSGKNSATAEELIYQMKAYRSSLKKQAGFQSEIASELAKSADQFISRRESTNGETILAGFPFFEDWGRDTMIALPGVCISTGQYEKAKSILRTFAANEKEGLMPNLFPEGGNAPMYNTADAALLFINCVYLYDRAVNKQKWGTAKDALFIREMYPVMKRIIDGYRAGTAYGIHMDADGLIMAGEGLDQVTWMDVRVGDILPTPRHGKPVEINAYWYNALCIMRTLGEELGEETKEYQRLCEQVRTSFRRKFWQEEKGYLKDLVSGTEADEQIRCNQIWAVSMPYTMLDRARERKVVETVFEKLYTPYGLRTLSEEDAQFRPFYGGEMIERDLAYHQGTVWAFPLGAYYLAYLKVNDNSEEARQIVREQLQVIESAMREGCIAQLPEIYDGKNPVSSKGCFAQAWSVGELLRVYEALEKQR